METVRGKTSFWILNVQLHRHVLSIILLKIPRCDIYRDRSALNGIESSHVCFWDMQCPSEIGNCVCKNILIKTKNIGNMAAGTLKQWLKTWVFLWFSKGLWHHHNIFRNDVGLKGAIRCHTLPVMMSCFNRNYFNSGRLKSSHLLFGQVM